MPPAPFQVVRTRTVVSPASAGCTVQVVTIEERVSVSTRVSGSGWLTSTSWSRTRLEVAAKRQATRVPAPWPPDSTR